MSLSFTYHIVFPFINSVLLINYLYYAVYFPIREPLKRNLPTTFCYDLDGIAKKQTKTTNLSIFQKRRYFCLKTFLNGKLNQRFFIFSLPDIGVFIGIRISQRRHHSPERQIAVGYRDRIALRDVSFFNLLKLIIFNRPLTVQRSPL